MEPQFADIKIGDKVSVELEMFYWLEIVTWIDAVSNLQNVEEPSGIRRLQHIMLHKIFPPAFLKAATAHIAEEEERRHQHPLITLLQMARESAIRAEEDGETPDE